MKDNSNIVTEEELFAALSAGIAEAFAEESRLSVSDDDYEDEYVSEDEIARENGFWVDEDGHWRELDEDDDW